MRICVSWLPTIQLSSSARGPTSERTRCRSVPGRRHHDHDDHSHAWSSNDAHASDSTFFGSNEFTIRLNYKSLYEAFSSSFHTLIEYTSAESVTAFFVENIPLTATLQFAVTTTGVGIPRYPSVADVPYIPTPNWGLISRKSQTGPAAQAHRSMTVFSSPAVPRQGRASECASSRAPGETLESIGRGRVTARDVRSAAATIAAVSVIVMRTPFFWHEDRVSFAHRKRLINATVSFYSVTRNTLTRKTSNRRHSTTWPRRARLSYRSWLASFAFVIDGKLIFYT
jgi:hypothetical protein